MESKFLFHFLGFNILYQLHFLKSFPSYIVYVLSLLHTHTQNFLYNFRDIFSQKLLPCAIFGFNTIIDNSHALNHYILNKKNEKDKATLAFENIVLISFANNCNFRNRILRQNTQFYLLSFILM